MTGIASNRANNFTEPPVGARGFDSCSKEAEFASFDGSCKVRFSAESDEFRLRKFSNNEDERRCGVSLGS